MEIVLKTCLCNRDFIKCKVVCFQTFLINKKITERHLANSLWVTLSLPSAKFDVPASPLNSGSATSRVTKD